MHRSPWHVKSERSEMEELYHDNILWLLFLQFICCVSVLAWCIGIKCTTSWHEERIVPSFTTGCGDNVCVSDCVLAWAVPFSIWLNAHMWPAEVILVTTLGSAWPGFAGGCWAEREEISSLCNTWAESVLCSVQAGAILSILSQCCLPVFPFRRTEVESTLL